MRRPTAALAATLIAFPGLARAQNVGPWSAEATVASAPEDGLVRDAFDPAVPASITTMAIGGGFGLLGLATVGGPEDTTVEECGLTGCADVTYPDQDRSWSTPLIAGGATTAAGGLALLLVAASDPARGADPGRARVAAGTMTLSLGAGLAVSGITAQLDGHEGSFPGALIATGLVTGVVGAPFLAWGASTWDEAPPGARYASSGRIVAGSVLTGAGVVATAGSVAMMVETADCSGGPCGLYTAATLPFVAIGGAALGVGIPLLVGGSRVEDDAGPTLAVGPGSVDATWRFQ